MESQADEKLQLGRVSRSAVVDTGRYRLASDVEIAHNL